MSSENLKKNAVNIYGYFFLVLFLGFFGSNTFFEHSHIYDGNIIVHSHPFKHGKDGKPLHSHTSEGYMMVFMLNNYIAETILSLSLASVLLFFTGKLNAWEKVNFGSGLSISSILLRGPPSVVLN